MSAQATEHQPFFALIDQVVMDELAPGEWERLRAHLQTCPSCRARYDRAVLAERMLHGGPDAAHRPSPAEFDRIAQAVLAPAPSESLLRRMLAWFAPTQRWMTGVVAVAAMIALVPILTQKGATKPAPTAAGDSFQARGGHGSVELFSSHPELKTARLAGLRAFCLDGSQVAPLDPTGQTVPACARSGQLKLAVSNPGKFSHVFLVGMDDAHALKWYAPKPSSTVAPEALTSVPAPAGATEAAVPVGASVRLEVNHQPGPVRIYALFSDRPIVGSEVQAASRELARRHVGAAEAVTLPIARTDVLQRSLLIDVQP